MQPIVRQTSSTTSNYGYVYPAGTAVSTRGDFDSLDNPFHYTSDPTGDRYSEKPAAGSQSLPITATTASFPNSCSLPVPEEPGPAVALSVRRPSVRDYSGRREGERTPPITVAEMQGPPLRAVLSGRAALTPAAPRTVSPRLTRNEWISGRCTSRSAGAKTAGRVLHPLQGVAVAVPQDP